MILGWIPLLRLGNLPFQLCDVAVWKCTQVFNKIDSGRKKMPSVPFLEGRTLSLIVLLIFYKTAAKTLVSSCLIEFFASFSKKKWGSKARSRAEIAFSPIIPGHQQVPKTANSNKSLNCSRFPRLGSVYWICCRFLRWWWLWEPRLSSTETHDGLKLLRWLEHAFKRILQMLINPMTEWTEPLILDIHDIHIYNMYIQCIYIYTYKDICKHIIYI